MLELIVGILLAAGAAYYVLLPILRPAPEVQRGKAQVFTDEGDDPDDDWSPQTVALRALKEIEFDKATGKLADADYETLKAKYTGEALEAMRAEQGAASKEQRKPAPRAPRPVPSCPQHGPRPEKDAVFCSDCGRRVGSAPAYCTRCGTEMEKGARYCERCGARVAA